MKTGLSRLLTTTALGAPLALGAFAAEANSDIGKVAAVNPSMDGTPPEANARQLSVGAGVLQNERIETSEDGSGQLLFLDQTSLSIAPRSDIVLDKYVYDPDQQSGEVAVTLTKGVLRLIGGRITKRTDGIIRTPTATIGVRGGLALVIVDPDGQTRVCHVAGEYTKVDSLAGGQIVLSRPNACAVVAAGIQPTFEGLIESDELAEIYRQIEGDGNGGRTIAADAIDTADVSSVNSSQKRGPNDTPVSTSGHSFVPEEGSLDEDQNRQDDDVRVFVVEVPNNAPPPAPVSAPPVSTPPPTGPTGPFVTGLAGGSVISQPFTGAAGSTFVQVLQGSLIGETFDGEELRIPVPDTDGIADSFFDTDNIIANFIPPDAEFTATDLAPSSGLFEFFLGDEEFNFDTGDQIAGSTSSVLGDIRGVGFTDQAEEFTYVEFTDALVVSI
ncbi:MAG: FecR domain-containing protein, partial [Pseudomonadota bacterium]